MNVMLSSYALKYPLTGIGWYTRYLIEGLQTHAAITQLIGVPRLSVFNSDPLPHCVLLKLKKMIRSCPGIYSGLNYYRCYRFKKNVQQASLKKFIYHEPCYILKPYLGLKIATIHDLSHIYFSHSHPRERVNFLLRYLPKSIDEAHHLITDSQFIRNEIINYFKIPGDKITSVYLGVSTIFRPRPLTELYSALIRYALLGKSYLLSVGSLEPRKNLERLLQAFSQLPEKQRKQYPLVLVGMKEKGGMHRLERLIKRLLVKGELYYLGYVSALDLPYLYSGAHAFAYLSLYEGFGLPLLEAMASGIPTLASNSSSMPEVVEDAALVVDPFNVDAIADKLQQLLTDEPLRVKLRQQGLAQSAKFTWKSCVENTVKIYRQVTAQY